MRAALLLVVILGCSPAPEPVPPDEDSGYSGGELLWCEPACDRLVKTGCDIGCEGSAQECLTECLSTCTNVESSGTVSLHPKCISQLDTLTPPDCPEMEACQ